MKMTSDRTDSGPPQKDGFDPLEAFFDAGRATAPMLGSELRARILAEAEGAAIPAASAPRPGVLRRLVSGWALPGFASGATAALLGLWVGFAAPLPVVALDVPDWMLDALSYVDVITMPLIGPGDPILLGM